MAFQSFEFERTWCR